jgi:hypothetical protein
VSPLTGKAPPRGEPDVEEVTAALRELETGLFVVVEQDRSAVARPDRPEFYDPRP